MPIGDSALEGTTHRRLHNNSNNLVSSVAFDSESESVPINNGGGSRRHRSTRHPRHLPRGGMLSSSSRYLRHWPLRREQTLLLALVASVLWVNCRYTLHLVSSPYNPFTATTNPHTFLPRYQQDTSGRQTLAGVASLVDVDDDLVSHAVAIERAFEFANVSAGAALGTASGDSDPASKPPTSSSFDAYYRQGKDKAPDSVHDHTMSYPAWVHRPIMVVPHEYLQSPPPPSADSTVLTPTNEEGVHNVPSDKEANDRLCAALEFADSKALGAIVLDAGWWAPGDMFKPNTHLILGSGTGGSDPARKRSLLHTLLATRCSSSSQQGADKTSPSTTGPVVLPWVSPLIPTTDVRWRIGVSKGYFLHTGEELPKDAQRQADATPGDEKRYTPKQFRWFRKGVVRSTSTSTDKGEEGKQYRDYVIEGSLIDFSNPSAVRWFIMDETYGLYALFAAFDDIAGVRCGGVDVLIRAHGTNPHVNGRLLGKSGAVSSEEYTNLYYSEVYHGGHNIISKLKKIAENEARDAADGTSEQQTATPVDLKREFVMMARTVDSHNEKHRFNRYSAPDTTSIGFVGDHSLTYGDLRNSALNVIHSAYHCFPNVGTVLGRKGEKYAAALRESSSVNNKKSERERPQGHDHTFREVEDALVAFRTAEEDWETLWKEISTCPVAPTHTRVADAIERDLTRRWNSFSSLLPMYFITPETVRLVGGDALAAISDHHSALSPYFAANTKRTQLFDYASLHVQTDANSAFKYYHNAHGNPYCAVRYLPSFYHRMFGVDASATLNSSARTLPYDVPAKGGGIAVKQYARSRSLSRNDLPHVLFQPPLSDYQFGIGPDMLAVPSLLPPSPPTLKEGGGRRVSFPLPQSSPGLDLRSCHVSSAVDDGGLGGLDTVSMAVSPKGALTVVGGAEKGGDAKVTKVVVDSSMWIDQRDMYSGEASSQQGRKEGGLLTGLAALLPTTREDIVLTRRGSLIPMLVQGTTTSTSSSSKPRTSNEILLFASDLPIFCDGDVAPSSLRSVRGSGNITGRLASILSDYYSYTPSFEAMVARTATVDGVLPNKADGGSGPIKLQDFVTDRVGAGSRYKSSVPFSYTHWMGAKMILNGLMLLPSRERIAIIRYRPTATDLPVVKQRSRFSAQEVAVSVVLPPPLQKGSEPTTVECACQSLPPFANADTPAPPTLPPPSRIQCKELSAPQHNFAVSLNTRHTPLSSSSSSSSQANNSQYCVLETAAGGWRRLVVHGSATVLWSCACTV